MRIPARLLICLFFVLSAFSSAAQKVTFEVSAPTAIPMGTNFRVEFTMNARPDSFTPPAFADWNLIAGPQIAESTSINIVNGSMQRTEEYIYTFVIQGKAEGIFNIEPARLTVDGKEYTTRQFPIQVVNEGGSASAGQQHGGSGQAGQSSGQQGGGQQPQQAQPRQPSTEIDKDDLFIRALVDNRNVYKGQPVRVVYKLYSRVPVVGSGDLKMPEFNGFWKQDVNVSRYPVQNESYNSKVYSTQVLFEYLLYPQQSGTLQLEPMEMTIMSQVVVQNRSRSLFDDIFGGADIRQVPVKVSTQPISIQVKDLPGGAPASFNGAVGNFTMNVDFPEGAVAANSSVNYVVRITGTGNLPLIQAPRLELHNSFEQYNVQTTQSFNETSAGITGYKQFEYPVIARAEGEYSMEPVKFSYFDPGAASYRTLTSKEFNIVVVPDSLGARNISSGLVAGVSKEDLRILDQDIRFIKLGPAGLVARGSILMGSLFYFLLLLLIISVFVFLLIYLQKRIKEMQNKDLVRGKRANKVALQRLKAAETHMRENRQRNFYEEMLRALWGYMGDKLNIPVSSLTKENVREELMKKGVAPDHITQYIELISDCEYAQYSPDGSGHMQDIYRRGVDSITKFESVIKK